MMMLNGLAAWKQAFWFQSTSFILPSTNIIFTGDLTVDRSRPAIIISNHQVGG